ncbi:hypothetical protein [Adonisia turfae]|uniref:hypothetical protein n=1 Tax=Adonisia turfae TaxID=2950184 RepID=UPI002029A6C3|nr:hypothetical protein [Adonisia turfae]
MEQSDRCISFHSEPESGNANLIQAQNETSRALSGPVYRFDVFNETNSISLSSGSAGEEDYRIDIIYTLFVGTSDFLLAMARRGNGSQARSPWQTLDV